MGETRSLVAARRAAGAGADRVAGVRRTGRPTAPPKKNTTRDDQCCDARRSAGRTPRLRRLLVPPTTHVRSSSMLSLRWSAGSARDEREPRWSRAVTARPGQQVQLGGAGARCCDDLVAGVVKTLLIMPPKRKTMATIRAAMPATSRPYSTAEAPSSSRRATRLADVDEDELEHDVPSLWELGVVSFGPNQTARREKYVKTGQIGHRSSGLNQVTYLGGFVHSP